MRVPPNDAPRRPLGIRAWLIGVAIALVILLTSLRGLALFYTDFLWFDTVGFSHTWRGLLAARVVPALVFTAVFFVILLVNLVIADRVAPRRRPMGPEDEIVEHYRSYVAPFAGRVRVAIALFFAFVFGLPVASRWQDWILFRNAVDFGVKDPQFHRDVGFYVFRLPFLQLVAGWLFAALVAVFVVTTIAHYVNGGIRLRSPFQLVTPQVKAHLSVILAAMAFTRTAQYWLARFELAFSTRGAVDGASYTDVKAQLPALNFLMVISIAAAALFIVNIWRRGWVLPVIAVGLWAFISLVVGTIYPAYIQRFQVEPNEFARERPYIERNIEATRAAFRLDDDNVEVRSFDYEENVDAKVLSDYEETFENARLWDPSQLVQTFRALQELRSYYAFVDVDIDRYRVGDKSVPALIAARELNEGGLPSRTWTNQNLVYTHGYGAAAATANGVTQQAPQFLLSDIPPRGQLKLGQPGVYFGENLGGFAVVDTNVEEFQPVNRSGEAAEEGTTRYAGSGGVPVSNVLRKAALALRFGSWNLFVSGQLNSDSRVIYVRDVRERVQKAAPFLRYDADPYPVVLDGRILWIVDAYTVTDRYPYSQRIDPSDLPARSGLDTQLNYVRNSVKVTVDAYDGTIHYYVVDESDPMARAYRKAFPELFSDDSELPEGLREHFRYPEDLFRVQTDHYATYHMTDPQAFYKRSDLWAVAPSAGITADEAPVVTAAGTTTTVSRGNNGGRADTLQAEGDKIEPLYLMQRLPGDDHAEFVLTRPYVPINRVNQLRSFVAGRSDPGEQYGRLVVYVTPDNSDAPSPIQAATQIDADPKISEQFTLLDRRGSRVLRGNVQLLPIGDTILYLRPVYVEGRSGSSAFPRFKFVAVTYGERSVLAESVGAALQQLFGDQTPASLRPTEGQAPSGAPSEQPPSEAVPGDVATLLERAESEFTAAARALADQDWATYGEHISRAEALVGQARAALEASSGAGGVGGSPTTSTTTPPAPAPTTTAPPASTTTVTGG